MHEQGGLPIPGIHHIGQPDWYAEGGDQSPEEFGLARARELEEKILELGADKVAAFIGRMGLIHYGFFGNFCFVRFGCGLLGWFRFLVISIRRLFADSFIDTKFNLPCKLG